MEKTISKGEIMKVIILLFSMFSLSAYSSEQFDITLISEVEDFIEINKPKDVLVVLDIDNTVLAMDKSFGSDQWFNWQRSLLGSNDKDLLASSFDQLLELQNVIFTLSHMHPVEEKFTTHFIDKLQANNIPVIALTSRSPSMRNNTERELAREKILFSKTKIGSDFAVNFKRKTSYQNGIYMTSGQHKGEMLKYLLSTTQHKFKTIIFVDDHKKHTDHVFDSFKNTDTDIYTFRYGYEDLNVDRFVHGRKYQARLLGQQTISLLSSIRN